MTTTETKEITNSDDVIDVRDITDRVEYLEQRPTLDDDGACYSCGSRNLKEGDEDHDSDCEVLELQRMNALLEDLKDAGGGDHDWRDSWYPVTLIRQSYFKDYAQELAEDIGAVGREQQWPLGYIDWEAASEALLQDYSEVEFEGVTYYWR